MAGEIFVPPGMTIAPLSRLDPAGGDIGDLAQLVDDGSGNPIWQPVDISSVVSSTPSTAKPILKVPSAQFPDGPVLDDSPSIGIDYSVPGTVTADVLEVTVDKLAASPAATPGDVLTIEPDGVTIAPRPSVAPGTGSIGAYSTQVVTTGLLANNATEQLVINLAKSVLIQRIEVSAAATVRVYTTNARMVADSGRLLTVDPTFGSPGEPSIQTSPGVGGYPLIDDSVRDYAVHNGDNPRQGRLYLAVTNRSGGTLAITVTFRYLPLEGSPATVGTVASTGLVYDFNALSITGVSDGSLFAGPWPNDGTLGDAPLTGAGATYQAAGMNGRAALRFTDGSHYDMPANAGFSAADIFAVLKMGATSPPFHLGTPAFGPSFPYTADGSLHLTGAFATTRANTDYGPIGTDTTAPFIFHVHSMLDEYEISINGVTIFSDTVNTVNNLGSRWLGAYNQGGFLTVAFNGWMGRLLAFLQASGGGLSSVERSDTISALAAEWGIIL